MIDILLFTGIVLMGLRLDDQKRAKRAGARRVAALHNRVRMFEGGTK